MRKYYKNNEELYNFTSKLNGVYLQAYDMKTGYVILKYTDYNTIEKIKFKLLNIITL